MRQHAKARRWLGLALIVVGLVTTEPVSGSRLEPGGLSWPVHLPLRVLKDLGGQVVEVALLVDKDCPEDGCRADTDSETDRPNGGPRVFYLARSADGAWEVKKSWPALYGAVEGPKVKEGDRKTPEGLYRLLLLRRKSSNGEEYRSFGTAFLQLDHPNGEDRTIARERGVNPGGYIGFHGGQGRPTLGCIRLLPRRGQLSWHEFDDAIVELSGLLRTWASMSWGKLERTVPVIIVPNIAPECGPEEGQELSQACGGALDSLFSRLARSTRPSRAQVIAALADPGAFEDPVAATDEAETEEQAAAARPSDTAQSPRPATSSEPKPEPPVTTLVIGADSAFASSTLSADSELGQGCLDPLLGRTFVDCSADRLLDGRRATAWCEGTPGLGECTTLDFELEDAPVVRAVRVHNGYLKTRETFQRNGRVRTLRVTAAGNSYDYRLDAHEVDPQDLELPEPVAAASVRLQMLDVEEGTVYDDTCLTEVEFLTQATGGAIRPFETHGGTGPTCHNSEPSDPDPVPGPKPPEVQDTDQPEEANVTPVPFVPPSVSLTPSSTLLTGCKVDGRNGPCRARYLADNRPETAWCEGVDGAGQGQWIDLVLDQRARLEGLSVLPGYTKDHATWQANGRPRALEVRVDDADPFTVPLATDYRVPTLIPIPSATPVLRVRLTMSSVIPGSRWQDTCISTVDPLFTSDQ